MEIEDGPDAWMSGPLLFLGGTAMGVPSRNGTQQPSRKDYLTKGFRMSLTPQQPKRSPILYAIMKTDLEEHPVLVEHGGPQYMAMFYEGDKETEYNWYGLLIEEASFARLRLEVQGNAYTWKFIESFLGEGTHHFTKGDIFAQWTYVSEDEAKEQENPWTIVDLMGMGIDQLRMHCRSHDILYYNEQTRTQLAMMLNAPVVQELECPGCNRGITGHHESSCWVALCTVTGTMRKLCEQKHGGFCGLARWNGFLPGVLEAFVYNTTPEQILAEGHWDPKERVFVLAGKITLSEDVVDETIDAVAVDGLPATDKNLRENVNELLANLGQRATENAAASPDTKMKADELGIPSESRKKYNELPEGDHGSLTDL